MASANLNLVRSLGEAWDRGDFSAAEWAHPEIEWEIADGPAPGRWKGVAGMVEGWRDFLSAWEDWRSETDGAPRELDDERILGLFRFSGRGKRSGLEVGQIQTKAAILYQIRGGKVTRLVIYFDRERAFEDLGLPSETSASS